MRKIGKRETQIGGIKRAYMKQMMPRYLYPLYLKAVLSGVKY